MQLLRKFFLGTVDVPSPSDIVPSESIYHLEGSSQVHIDLSRLNIPFSRLPKVWIPPVPDTNSMDPGFDHQHNPILIAGADEENQQIMVEWLAQEWKRNPKTAANIIVYQLEGGYPYIHRIVAMGEDAEGRYWRLRGDNNFRRDPYKVRDRHIKWLCIGTVY
jgi:hypothetical protein